MSNTQGIETIPYLEYIYKSSVYFCNPKEYNILTYDAYQSHYFFKNLFLKIENIAAIWIWKSDILQQLANLQTHKVSYLFILPLIGELGRNDQDQSRMHEFHLLQFLNVVWGL